MDMSTSLCNSQQMILFSFCILHLMHSLLIRWTEGQADILTNFGAQVKIITSAKILCIIFKPFHFI